MSLRIGPLVAALAVTIGVLSIAGCKSDAQFSQKETQQFKEGPPKEMPAEARAMFNRAGRGPGGPPAGAQPPAGR